MRSICALLLCCVTSVPVVAQDKVLPPSKVDFSTFMKLAQEVQPYRQQRLLSLDQFLEAAREPGAIVLDARSKEMYDEMHLKGAVHLDFSDFTQARLDALIPSKNTRVLIYCNNNFDDAPRVFATKMALPIPVADDTEPLTLALNIPTFINLYGYGYRNVYELENFVSIRDPRLEFEGRVISERGRRP
ncbi:MAG: rhodanese-like domain-containing protein [Xanthomonadaceae bacterium]|jgi:hypothetical protein|nr:rhodanese-like domain-containing protein [Xanthomonadaceae bacterium]